MTTTEPTLSELIEASRLTFVRLAEACSEAQFTERPNGKWSVAEAMQHLYLSARPVPRLMSGPRDVLRQWGVPDVPPRSFAEIADAYQQVFAKGVKAPAAVSPRPEDMAVDKATVLARYSDTYQALTDALTGWSDPERDQYVMLHPVLGKLSVREMIYFTSIHTAHHRKVWPMV